MSKDCQFCKKPLSVLQQKRGQKFCSRECKNENQKKRIEIICTGCSKKISIWPYLKRKSNYCSRECYWISTKRKKKKICKVCGKEFVVKAYLAEQGFGVFCSKRCQHRAYPAQVDKVCQQCGEKYKAQPARADKRKFCSKECKDDFERDDVKRRCKNCRKTFELPRWELNKGKGTFCSRDCFIVYNGESSIEAKVRKALESVGISYQQEVKIGVYRADFLLKNLNVVLECDGEYWHSRPWSENRDKRKDLYLKNKGYKVIRIPEQRIKKSPETELINEIYKQL